MPSQSKPSRASQRYSAGTQFDIPMSVFNQDLLKASGHRSSTPGVKRSGSRSSKRASQHRSVPKSPDSSSDSPKSQQRPRINLGGIQNSSNSTTYARPLGHELVCSKHPSCSKLPPSWNQIHDRFIAYLSTHAPLDRNGDIPRNEERRECWKSEDIARLVMERFPEIGRYYQIKASHIEKRLALLDQAENDYFKMPYGSFKFEEWGRGI